MSQNVEERKKCNRELAAEDGCLNSAFTLNKWFVKVRPCYGIGKVCFSFVLKTQKAEENICRFSRNFSSLIITVSLAFH